MASVYRISDERALLFEEIDAAKAKRARQRARYDACEGRHHSSMPNIDRVRATATNFLAFPCTPECFRRYMAYQATNRRVSRLFDELRGLSRGR